MHSSPAKESRKDDVCYVHHDGIHAEGGLPDKSSTGNYSSCRKSLCRNVSVVKDNRLCVQVIKLSIV